MNILDNFKILFAALSAGLDSPFKLVTADFAFPASPFPSAFPKPDMTPDALEKPLFTIPGILEISNDNAFGIRANAPGIFLKAPITESLKPTYLCTVFSA